MPHEITSRIRRDELLELLETEAPVTNQRTTAPMPAVTLTDLLCIREEDLPHDDQPAEPPPPARRMRANTVPAPDRSPVRAIGTDLEITALAPASASPAAPPAPVVSRTSTYDTPALIVDRAPTLDACPISIAEAAHELAQMLTRDAHPAVSRTLTPKTLRIQIPTDALTPLVPLTLEHPPIEASEIASVLERLQEVDGDAAAPATPEPPPAFFAISFAMPPVTAQALTTEQLRTVSLRPMRPLVIAASCLVTLVLALLMISLL